MSSLGFGYDTTLEQELSVLSGPMDSPWPMESHDVRHTGRSPYSTKNIDGSEKWRFFSNSWVDAGIAIDKNGVLYFGDRSTSLYALYPNGTLKWKIENLYDIDSTPAIADDGTIYIGSWDRYFYAISSEGLIKWKYHTDEIIASSPAICDDGTIYFGTAGSLSEGGRIIALNPDGTLKWWYRTENIISSAPAIGEDGTIYFGSIDYYFYAMYPNGTLKWRFKTGYKILGDPSIADDGTIYFGSKDDYLYALNPDGSLKWKINTEWGPNSNPSIGEDGTIYVGTDRLFAIHPNGNIKWTYNLGPERWVGGSSPTISADGTIYVGTHIHEYTGGEIIAINPDGTEKWRKMLSDHGWVSSSPSIGEDGTVYIGCSINRRIGPDNNDRSIGYIHAFGEIYSNSPPEPPIISGKSWDYPTRKCDHWFVAHDPDNNPLEFYIDWGDGTNTGWIGQYAPNEKIVLCHTWLAKGDYKIKAKVRDIFGEESEWSYFDFKVKGDVFLTALLYGDINNFEYIDEYGEIKFNAKNLIVIKLLPFFSVRRFFLGQEVILLYYFGTLDAKFVCALCGGYIEKLI